MGMPVISVTLESVTYSRNATTTLVRDQNSVQSRNRNAYGVIVAAGMMNRPTHSSWGLGVGEGTGCRSPSQCVRSLAGEGASATSSPTPICLFPIALLSTGLVAAVLLAVSRLCAPLGLLVTVKESLMLSKRKASLL